jgi:parvulin-like peptidyl-prolyl isomerase
MIFAMKRAVLPRRLPGLGLALVLAGCGGGGYRDAADRPAAQVGARVVTVGQIEAYLEAVLATDLAEDEGPGDLDRVKSRLLDDYVDEELLLLEAERQGVRVSEAELADYLGADPDGTGPLDAQAAGTLHRLARRNLAIQKFREAVARQEAKVTEVEVDAWLASHPPEPGAGKRVILSSMLLASSDQAEPIYRDLRRGRITFPKAAETYDTSGGHGEPMEVALDGLPEEVRLAVESLKPGEVSRPVDFHGSVYLFRVEAWVEPKDDVLWGRRERARDDLLRLKYETVSRRLLDHLREEHRVEVYPQNLRFRYVADYTPGGRERNASR